MRGWVCLLLTNKRWGRVVSADEIALQTSCETGGPGRDSDEYLIARSISVWRRAAWAVVNVIAFCGLLMSWSHVAQAQAFTASETERFEQQARLSIRNFVGRLVIEPAQGDAIEITRLNSGRPGDLRMNAYVDGLSLELAGEIVSSPSRCVRQSTNGENAIWRINGRSIESFPVVIVAVPSRTRIDVEFLAGTLSIQAGDHIEGAIKGCSDVQIDAAGANMTLQTKDSAVLSIAAVQNIQLAATGGSRTSIEAINASASILATGASRITVAGMTGNLSVRQNGASRMTVTNGATTRLDLVVAGAAHFSHEGDVDAAWINLQRGARAELALLHELKSISLARATRLQVGDTIFTG